MQTKERPTLQNINNIAEAYRKFSELSVAKITTPTTNAEISGLKNFLREELLKYCEEFLGAWYAARMEYEPMFRAFAALYGKVQTINRAVEKLSNDA